MTNRWSIFFIISCITTNFNILYSSQKLELVSEIAKSHQHAKSLLDRILPGTFFSISHQKKYALLQKLNTQIEELLHHSVTTTEDDIPLKTLLTEYEFNSAVAYNLCEKEYAIFELFDTNNSEIDSNDINIANTYQAFKRCNKIILMHIKKSE